MSAVVDLVWEVMRPDDGLLDPLYASRADVAEHVATCTDFCDLGVGDDCGPYRCDTFHLMVTGGVGRTYGPRVPRSMPRSTPPLRVRRCSLGSPDVCDEPRNADLIFEPGSVRLRMWEGEHELRPGDVRFLAVPDSAVVMRVEVQASAPPPDTMNVPPTRPL